MSTSKTLQVPKILGIIGSTISIAHPDLSNYPKTYLASTIAASGTASNFYDNNGFADDDWFIVGAIGDSKTEECDVNGTVTRGTSVTVTNSLKFSHELDAPVQKIFERGIRIYGTNTTVAAGVLIASVDAITTPIADAVMIQWNREHSEYTMISTDTVYTYYFCKFSDGTTLSDASDLVEAAGLSSSSVEYFIQQALQMTNSDLGEGISREWLVRCANDAQLAITQFVYQDKRSNLMKNVDWDFEIDEDTTTLSIIQNQNKYSVSSLNLKYPNAKGIINVRMGSKKKMMKITPDEMDDLFDNTPQTQLSVQTLAGDTTVTVDSNVEFADAGTLYIGSDLVTYTGKSSTTGFTGVPASGSGSITATHAVDSNVWQNIAPTEPDRYTVFDGNLILNAPPDVDFVNFPINLKFYKKLTALTESNDTTAVTFTNVFPYFIASRIETRRQNSKKAEEYMNKFTDMVEKNANRKDTFLKNKKIYYSYTAGAYPYGYYKIPPIYKNN